MPENCAAIVIAAKHHELLKVKDTRGTTHTVGALRCKFEFRTPDWLNSAKTAMFCNGNAILHPEVIDRAIAVPLDSDDECAVPYEVLTDTLPYSIGIWGVTKSGLRIVSKWLVFNAQLGCYTEGNAPADPDPTIYEQILSTSKNAVDTANKVLDMANNGELDGESAYEVAQRLGYEGTEAEWVASLKGERGVGVDKIIISENGEMIVYLSDGTYINLGIVKVDMEAHIAESDKKYETKSDANEKLHEAKEYAEKLLESCPPKEHNHTVSDLTDFNEVIEEVLKDVTVDAITLADIDEICGPNLTYEDNTVSIASVFVGTDITYDNDGNVSINSKFNNGTVTFDEEGNVVIGG